MDKGIPSGIKTGWWSFELPQYRPQTAVTYSLFSYNNLPPLPEEPKGDFLWLLSQPDKERSLTEGGYNDGSKPDLNKLSEIASQAGIALPKSFTTFIQSAELQGKIRSCTDCYLDVGDFAVKTAGGTSGFLIHFLSDSQWCLHWSLYIDASGGEFVLASLEAYGFAFGEPEIKHTIDLAQEEIWYCAPTFSEFIYRFWLENEIWYALAWDKRPLTKTEQAYVDHYRKLRNKG